MEGATGAGKTITVAMTAEKEVVPEPVRILECDPPTSFVVDVGVGESTGIWRST